MPRTLLRRAGGINRHVLEAVGAATETEGGRIPAADVRRRRQRSDRPAAQEKEVRTTPMIPILVLSALGLISLVAAVGIVRFLRFNARALATIRRETFQSWLLTGADLLSAFVTSVGVMIAASPLPLYGWIHGDDDRYRWILSGPFPYSALGGGPSQAAMYSGLFAAGLLVVGGGLLMRWQFWRTVAQQAS